MQTLHIPKTEKEIIVDSLLIRLCQFRQRQVHRVRYASEKQKKTPKTEAGNY